MSRWVNGQETVQFIQHAAKGTDSLKSKRSTAFIELTNKSIRFGNPLETGLWQKCNYLNPAFMTHF